MITVRIKKIHLTLGLIAVACFLIGFFTHAWLSGTLGKAETTSRPAPAASPPTALGANPGANQSARNAQGQVILPSSGQAPFLGSPRAPITMIEFSDFQCPFCKSFFDQTLAQLRKQYVDAGEVRLVYMNFPLAELHPNAQKAAEAAACANAQGKFWAYHDKLFAEQPNWAAATDPVTLFKTYASDLQLDNTRFSQCIDNNQTASVVQSDYAEGQRAGVTGTPTFFINNHQLVGAQPFSTFQQIIDQELNTKK